MGSDVVVSRTAGAAAPPSELAAEPRAVDDEGPGTSCRDLMCRSVSSWGQLVGRATDRRVAMINAMPAATGTEEHEASVDEFLAEPDEQHADRQPDEELGVEVADPFVVGADQHAGHPDRRYPAHGSRDVATFWLEEQCGPRAQDRGGGDQRDRDDGERDHQRPDHVVGRRSDVRVVDVGDEESDGECGSVEEPDADADRETDPVSGPIEM